MSVEAEDGETANQPAPPRAPGVLHRLIRFPLRLIPKKAVVPILRGPLRGRRWIVGSFDHSCWLGSYERRKVEEFASRIASGNVVYDIGANVGIYSLLAFQSAGPRGRVYSFEPLPTNLAWLRRHIELNGAHTVEVVAAAVSETSGKAFFGGGNSAAQGRLLNDGELEVKTVSIDELVASGELVPPDLVKMDIEGGEYRALRGARETLLRFQPVIFLATHGPQVHASCCEFLEECGYRLSSLDGRSVETTDEILAVPDNR